jgi:hypothetical protein
MPASKAKSIRKIPYSIEKKPVSSRWGWTRAGNPRETASRANWSSESPLCLLFAVLISAIRCRCMRRDSAGQRIKRSGQSARAGLRGHTLVAPAVGLAGLPLGQRLRLDPPERRATLLAGQPMPVTRGDRDRGAGFAPKGQGGWIPPLRGYSSSTDRHWDKAGRWSPVPAAASCLRRPSPHGASASATGSFV